MNIILFGPPSAGKGTQAQILTEKYNLKHIATGDIFRYHIKNQTELGKKAKEYIDKGELVPDSLTVSLVETAIEENFLLDGFPRSIPQAKALDEMLQKKNLKIDAVIALEVDESELLKRVTGRRLCKNCQASYHIHFNRPKVEGKCDVCSGELYQRDDDTEETFINRLNVYRSQTEPVLDYYKDMGIVRIVEANCSVDEVTSKIIEVLNGAV